MNPFRPQAESEVCFRRRIEASLKLSQMTTRLFRGIEDIGVPASTIENSGPVLRIYSVQKTGDSLLESPERAARTTPR
jgi:hypothetical protein